MSLRPGVRFGPCEPLSPVGAGGVAEVYRALSNLFNGQGRLR